MTVAWVIGSRGMLGSAIARAVTRDAGWTLFDTPHLRWDAPLDELTQQAADTTALLLDRAGETGDDWAIIWAAGAAVTASSEDSLSAELTQLTAIFRGISERAAHSPTAGTLFYASSAGGVYAGSAAPPFTEATEPRPIAPYGRFKLQAEAVVTSAAEAAGIPSLIGRIANLYGPGQRLDKLQGLVSHIALARLTARPASIYVPLDTLRDYIFVDECAGLILDSMKRLAVERSSTTKILASGQATTIATLLGHFRALSRGRPRVVLGSSTAGALQAHDLRLRSVVWPDLDAGRTHSLPAGIQATMTDILATIQRGSS